MISHAFVALNTQGSFPLAMGVYSAILGFFIPSGGGKWLLEAPYVMQAANELKVHLGWAVQVYNAAEALPNLINPFFMLPLLGILGLKARDIVGFSFLNANLGLVHAIAHTLSARNHLAHGNANAVVLPYVMRYNAPSCPEMMIDLAKALDLPLSGDKEKDMYVLSDALLAMTKQIGIKTLSEQGVTEEDFDVIAENALKEVPLLFNPRQGVTKEDIIEILKKAF